MKDIKVENSAEQKTDLTLYYKTDSAHYRIMKIEL